MGTPEEEKRRNESYKESMEQSWKEASIWWGNDLWVGRRKTEEEEEEQDEEEEEEEEEFC